MANPSLERKIQRLLELGCTRAAAKSALRASRLDVEEAAVLIWDDKHADAMDVPSDDEGLGENNGNTTASTSRARTVSSTSQGAVGVAASSKGKQPAKQPTPAADSDEDRHNESDDDQPANDSDDDYLHDDDDAILSDNGSLDHGDGDAYGFVNMAKDRKETITEVEEPVKRVYISLTQRGQANIATAVYTEEAELVGQQRWMSGCPEGNEQQQLFPLYNMLAGNPLTPSKCPYNCGADITHYESDFFAMLPKFKSYLSRLARTCVTKCTKCSQSVCLACSEPTTVSCIPATEDVIIDSAPPVLLHCPNMQAVILGVGLFKANNLWDDMVSGASTSTAGGVTTKKRQREETNGRGVRIRNDGIGYAGPGNGGREDDSGQKAMIKIQQDRDNALAKLLSRVRVYLPNRDRPGAFMNSDHMPAGQTLAHLRRRFNPIASLLLSAESLSDMSERKELYTEFMAWLEIMSAHENLAGLMAQPIMRASSVTYKDSPSIDAVATSSAASSSTATAPTNREKVIVFEANPGPRELLEAILKQVQVAKKVSEAAKARDEMQAAAAAAVTANTGPTQPTQPTQNPNANPALLPSAALPTGTLESKRLLDFCDTITKAVTQIDKALKQTRHGKSALKGMNDMSGGEIAFANADSTIRGEAANNITTLSDEVIKERYVAWAKSCNYSYHDWEFTNGESAPGTLTVNYKHVYSDDAGRISSYPARNTALMKEHTALLSSLPATWDSSVFLKVDENRPDIIKGLIIGPDNTPYENGCYLFDILLGQDYNQRPPTVKSMTTKRGQYRLNPNLYAEGKVCLSLLGTWSGPGWVAGKSTLLQVLVSIQAMILCTEPIGNEPGFEKDLGGPRSKAYNCNVRRMAAHIAMLEYLKSPPEGFEDIIETHFRFKSRSLRAQLEKWLAEDDGKPLIRDSMSCIHSHSQSYAMPAWSGPPGSANPPIVPATTATAATGATAPSATQASQAAQPPPAGGSGSAFAKDVTAIKQYLSRLEKGESLAKINASAN